MPQPSLLRFMPLSPRGRLARLQDHQLPGAISTPEVEVGLGCPGDVMIRPSNGSATHSDIKLPFCTMVVFYWATRLIQCAFLLHIGAGRYRNQARKQRLDEFLAAQEHQQFRQSLLDMALESQ